jgi:toxin secretion/phage lysis holin
MKGEITLKNGVLSILGVAGAFVSRLFGGWDAALTTLLIFMAIDYLSGIVVAGVFKKSGKSETGALESRAGLKGICKKGMMLLIVLVAVRLDMMTGTSFLKDAVIVALVANEALSIMENAGLMGVKWPPVISNAIDVLKKKGESE